MLPDVLPQRAPDPMRSQVHITHYGQSSKSRATFSTPTRRPRFPPDLWSAGTLLYSVADPTFFPPLSDRLLRFNSHFESGNLDRAYHLGLDSYHVILEYDANKSGSCQWFYFSFSNVRKDVKYYFTISGFHKGRGVFANGAKVFWYSDRQARDTGVSWARGGSNYGFAMTDPNKRFSLQFQMKFPYDNDTVYVAYGLPYTYTDLLQYIRQWRTAAPALVTVSSLCRSFGGRDCPLLTIAHGAIEGKPVIFLTARCHPGESNGSVVLHGFIDFLVGGSLEANELLAQFVFQIVPMVCIDGVIEGNYRICLCGSDLNRMWAAPDQRLHPTVWATKALLRAAPPCLYIDFHGHSRMNGTFAYGCPTSEKGGERLFPKIIALLSEAFAFGSCTFSMPQSRLTASRCVVREEMGVVESFCIETSFCGVSSGRLSSVLYDEWLWKELGGKIGEATYHLMARPCSRVRAIAERAIGGKKEAEEENRQGKILQAVISRPNLSKKQAVSLPAIRLPGSKSVFPSRTVL
jgi:hypothetical protein